MKFLKFLPNLPGIVYIAIVAGGIGYAWLQARDAQVRWQTLAEARRDSLERVNQQVQATIAQRDSVDSLRVQERQADSLAIQAERKKRTQTQIRLVQTQEELDSHLEGDTVAVRLLSEERDAHRREVQSLNLEIAIWQSMDSVNQLRIFARDSTIAELQTLNAGLLAELESLSRKPSVGERIVSDLPKILVAAAAGYGAAKL